MHWDGPILNLVMRLAQVRLFSASTFSGKNMLMKHVFFAFTIFSWYQTSAVFQLRGYFINPQKRCEKWIFLGVNPGGLCHA